ncbi:MAG: GTPase, partial [Brevinematia bacterium]
TIEFQNVSFIYPETTKKVLDNISFRVKVGQTIAIVGESGSGKSTLMNVLTKANVLEKDELFSTLDTKTKRIFVDGFFMTITDTVGFIEGLPHQLIESFYSTLEVVKTSDLLLHVIDISSSFPEEKIEVVNGVLKEIFSEDGLDLPQIVYVFNKIDIVSDVDVIDKFSVKYPDAVFISAKEKINIDKVKERLKDFAKRYYSELARAG